MNNKQTDENNQPYVVAAYIEMNTFEREELGYSIYQDVGKRYGELVFD